MLPNEGNYGRKINAAQNKPEALTLLAVLWKVNILCLVNKPRAVFPARRDNILGQWVNSTEEVKNEHDRNEA